MLDRDQEKYIDSMFEMFRTSGWKMLMEDLTKNATNINSVEATKDNEDLMFRKGQLNIIAFLSSLETQVENMVDEKDLKENQPRLLTVDNEIYVPVDKVIKVMITANDVLHAWALPSFGVKRDAIPGRINETWFKAEKEGTYYGQCSELCGIKHAFMPITVKVVSEEDYKEWLSEARVKFAKEEIENDKLKLASK